MKTISLVGLFLLAVGTVRADSIETSTGLVYYPDGATITGIATGVEGDGYPYNIVSYSFADGTGSAYQTNGDSNVGEVEFSNPITSMTIGYTSFAGLPISLTLSNGQSTGAGVDRNNCPPYGCPLSTIQFTVDADIDGFSYFIPFGFESGISSLSYTEAPEPSSLRLLGIGLFGLAALRRSHSTSRA